MSTGLLGREDRVLHLVDVVLDASTTDRYSSTIWSAIACITAAGPMASFSGSASRPAPDRRAAANARRAGR